MIEAQHSDNDARHKFFGNYRAFVVDDEDPRDIGRIKVRVPGIYRETVPSEDLPWAIPALGLSRSGGDNMKPEMGADLSQSDLTDAFNKTGTGGKYVVPARGNHVWVWFDNGNHMNPVYFAMAPGEGDYLTQKQYVKDKIENKIKQIINIKEKFNPEDGVNGHSGIQNEWANGAHINTRQDITSGGQKAPYPAQEETTSANFSEGETVIQGGDYLKRKLSISNADKQGESSKNMKTVEEREWSNFITMDIKPLFDKEELEIKRGTAPHEYDKEGKMDEAEENQRNVNRFITSHTTQGGTTEVTDNRPGQENYYFIHKNYIENIDQEGSRKVFIGKNEPRETLVRSADTNDERNKGPLPEVRCNDELLIAGDKKTHVLGNSVDYVKGNHFIQVDKNTQIDINDSFGIRIKKGDFDIVINGSTDETRDKESGREDGKFTQYGDINIDVQNGHMDIHVKKNINIHAEGQVNLKADGDVRQTVLGSYHLNVKGDYNEIIEGNKYQTIKNKSEIHIGERKVLIDHWDHKTVRGKTSITTTALAVHGPIHCSDNIFSDKTNLNVYWKHVHGGVKPGPKFTSQWGTGGKTIDAESGENSGGGDSVQSGASVSSSKFSTNTTYTATRNNENRGDIE